MIVAYLLLVHAHPAQFARLVKALPAESPVLVHIDAKTPPDVVDQMKAAVADRPLTRFVARSRSYWGSFGLTRASVTLLQDLVASGWSFDYATLISGADYPIKSNAQIAEALERGHGAEYMEVFRLDEPNRWSDVKPKFRAPDRILRQHVWVGSRPIPLPRRRKLPYGLKPYGGHQWWTLTAEAIRYIDGYLKSHPRFIRYMKGTVCSDEAFFQTLMMASPMKDRITGEPLSFTIWDRPEPPYPAVLRTGDIDLLAATDAHFARKFDARDTAVYDLIDERLRGVRASVAAPVAAGAADR